MSTALPLNSTSVPSLPTTTLDTRITHTQLPTQTSIPLPNVPLDLSGLFQAPQLMVPLDRSNPTTALGTHIIAQLSSTFSTLYTFDIPPEYADKTCNLIFHVPPASQEWWQPFRMTTPGGMLVSRLEAPATALTNGVNVGASKPVGAVNLLAPGEAHLVSSAPCEAGARVGYRVDALGALELEYFQMSVPPSGLFVTAS